MDLPHSQVRIVLLGLRSSSNLLDVYVFSIAAIFMFVRMSMFSCRDDVGDHAKWAEKFGANRIIHKSEVNEVQGTVHCETQLEGSGPWFLEDGSEDLEFILVPGHSTGSICMFHSPTKALFSGKSNLTVQTRFLHHSTFLRTAHFVHTQRCCTWMKFLPLFWPIARNARANSEKENCVLH